MDKERVMNALQTSVKRLLCDEGGPTATEYAVLIAVICIAVISTMSAFGDHVSSIYSAIAEAAGLI